MTTSQENRPTYKEEKSMEYAIKVYHDLNNVGQVETDLQKIKSLSVALTDLVQNADIPIMDQIHLLQNTTLRLIYQNTIEYLDYKENEVKKQMCEDLK